MYTTQDYTDLAAIWGYADALYAEWVLEGDTGPRPALLANWDQEDLAAYCGGEFAKAEYAPGRLVREVAEYLKEIAE